MMNEQAERMKQGKLYQPLDDGIFEEQLLCLEKLYDYNATRPTEQEKRGRLLKEMFAEIGENCYVEPPLHANFGGKHVHFGDWVYANFNLTLVDDGHIYVGNDVMFAPNVVVATAGHPIDPTLRSKGLQFNADVHIGNNVWIGANCVILRGTKIGDNCVVAAGSVIKGEFPANTLIYQKRETEIKTREVGV